MSAVTTQNPGASAEAIQYHYDLSNDFYQLWLDRTQTYSCALWEENDTLETAQLRKLDFHINQVKAAKAERVLDIGCGWGSLLRRLVEKFEVNQAVGLTLSKVQQEWISSLNEPRIEVRLESWSDHAPEQAYDGIISIGAFEHFANPELSPSQRIEGYRTFFQRCRELLKPGGYLSLQTIAYGNAYQGNFVPFLGTEIFPESELPTLQEIIAASEGEFEISLLRNDRPDYEQTCRAWLSRLKANREAAVKLVGDEIVARYEKYLKFSIIGFHTRKLCLLRAGLRRID